jgi:hypothetical protein
MPKRIQLPNWFGCPGQDGFFDTGGGFAVPKTAAVPEFPGDRLKWRKPLN